ncbi:probable LRR receptor-like serine/threonine-protein kinase At1g05700 [Arachis ipaensis]|uniref:LRR receptor-like serine/threonine-protein kinase IOS1 isoform X1 n=1 Tax=Arachis hypogaea TaxID=3818 RepID=UPI000A2B6047|nr:probable LRR receptor-like serine/threonine-protein kinase At1g05700 [Arachis ipaensis]
MVRRISPRSHIVLLLLLIIVALVQAQDQSGFISIDCGLPQNSSYTEKHTSIFYISDSGFIDTGVSKSVSPEFKINLQQQLSNLRSFPSGIRNCYRINVTSATKYLIRASFYYGNYDGTNVAPKFDLHLGANFMDTVKFTNASVTTFSEIIYTPLLDYIHLCLVNTGTGTPFISAIELRTLKNDTYVTQSWESLARLRRFDLGSTTNLQYRYKDDVYDRIWAPLGFDLWTQISSKLTNDELTQNHYQPPTIVMSTAATPVNASASFDFYWDPDNVDEQYYVFMHFNEVKKLAPNETRSFNVTLNGKYWGGPLVPTYQSTSTIFSPSALAGESRYLFSLLRTEDSALPPIINAIEIYTVKDFSRPETSQDDVDAITNIKKAYGVARNWEADPCGPTKYIWQGLNCSYDGNDPPRITSLDLSSSGLKGQISSYISKLTMLQYLDLSNNNLSGSVPDFLTQLQSLKVLNLGNNNLTGLVPNGLLDKSKKGSLSLSVEHNPNLCASTSCNQQTGGAISNKKKKNNNNHIVIPIAASIAGVLVLLAIVATAVICGLKKRKPKAAVNIDEEHNAPNFSQFGPNQRQYTFNEIVKITNNFNRILGRGGFGTVYHGLIGDTQVAVKMLSPSAVRGYEQFLAEVKLLMVVHHRNLTSLIGYCNDESNIGLIYEYMANGNLEEHLSGKKNNAKLLTWEDRLRISVDAAQGLEYLHSGCKPPIIHRDVKCANILLNENFGAKLADFGLSKPFPTEEGTHISTVVAGTPGYLDPEYRDSNKLAEKSDVYSFGVVLLKMITGQAAYVKMQDDDNKPHISYWVSSMLSNGDIKSIVDSKLQEDFDSGSVWKAVETAMACVASSSNKRPHMSDVVTELKECLAAELARKRTDHATEQSDSLESDLASISVTTTEFEPIAR